MVKNPVAVLMAMLVCGLLVTGVAPIAGASGYGNNDDNPKSTLYLWDEAGRFWEDTPGPYHVQPRGEIGIKAEADTGKSLHRVELVSCEGLIVIEEHIKEGSRSNRFQVGNIPGKYEARYKITNLETHKCTYKVATIIVDEPCNQKYGEEKSKKDVEDKKSGKEDGHRHYRNSYRKYHR